MRIHRLPVFAVALLALALAPRPAQSWDSICYRYTDDSADVGALVFIPGKRGCEGASAARGRWRDPEKKVDEHRQIFAQAVIFAGLPAALLETQKLSVFVYDYNVPSSNGEVPTVKPRPVTIINPSFLGIKGATRAFALDELAQLPDFSYGLWDWASGNETCPLRPAVDAETCHAFKTHMGAVNANHFPPQSDAWYAHYHQIAMDRARACTANRSAARDRATARGESASTVDSNLKETWKACEVEALAYEAVAQHYLQDSWSAGHMWQRWGTSDLTQITNTLTLDPWWNADPDVDKKRLLIAEVVAALAGTVHGSDPALFEVSSGWATLHDQLSYPHRDVQGVTGAGIINTAGDLHLHDVLATPNAPTHSQISSLPLALSFIFGGHFDAQGNRLIACAGGSLGAVYDALKGPGGAFQPALGDAPASPVAFDAASCTAPMQTNDGMDEGVDDFGIGSFLIQTVGAYQATYGPLPPMLSTRASIEYTALQTRASLRSWVSSNGTHIATDPGTMLGVSPNGTYSTTPPDSLVDPKTAGPDLPFAGGGNNLALGSAPNSKSFWLTQTFRRSRAPEICTHQRETEFRVDLDRLVRAARAQPDVSTLSGDAKKSAEAVCQACAEYIGPYLWNTSSWNGSRLTGAPLCSYTADYPQTKVIDPNSGAWGLEPETVLIRPDGADTRWFAHLTTQNSRGGIDAVPIGYESPTNYIGGSAGATPEEMAKLICCAKLDTNGGRGNFRIQGLIRGQPLDSVVTFMLRPASAPAIENESMDPDIEQPIVSHLPTTDPAKGSRIIWTADADRFGVRYGSDPAAKAVYDTAKAITDDGGNGLRYHIGNPTRTWMDAGGTFVLTPMMAMDDKRGEHCTFDPPSRTLTLDATTPEAYDADFTMSCSDSVPFHIGYPKQFAGTGIPSRRKIETTDGDMQWVIGQRVFVNGPVSLQSIGVITPHAGGANLRMAIYKETAFAFPAWASSAELVLQTGPAALGDGTNTIPASATLEKGTYWIMGTFRGDDTDTTSLGVNFSVAGMAWGGAFLLPLDAAFPPTLSLATSNFSFYHLNYFLNVQ